MAIVALLCLCDALFVCICISLCEFEVLIALENRVLLKREYNTYGFRMIYLPFWEHSTHLTGTYKHVLLRAFVCQVKKISRCRFCSMWLKSVNQSYVFIYLLMNFPMLMRCKRWPTFGYHNQQIIKMKLLYDIVTPLCSKQAAYSEWSLWREKLCQQQEYRPNYFARFVVIADDFHCNWQISIFQMRFHSRTSKTYLNNNIERYRIHFESILSTGFFFYAWHTQIHRYTDSVWAVSTIIHSANWRWLDRHLKINSSVIYCFSMFAKKNWEIWVDKKNWQLKKHCK